MNAVALALATVWAIALTGFTTDPFALPAVIGGANDTGTMIVVGKPVTGSGGPGAGTNRSCKTPILSVCSLCANKSSS